MMMPFASQISDRHPSRSSLYSGLDMDMDMDIVVGTVDPWTVDEGGVDVRFLFRSIL